MESNTVAITTLEPYTIIAKLQRVFSINLAMKPSYKLYIFVQYYKLDEFLKYSAFQVFEYLWFPYS